MGYLASHPALDRLLAASRGRPEDVDELLESLPEDADAFAFRAAIAVQQRARWLAITLADRALELDPDNARAKKYRARAEKLER